MPLGMSLGACEPNFGRDISFRFHNAPGNGWVVVDGDCSATQGCDDYFVVTCNQGALVQASFCSFGGDAVWDTNLSVWEGNTERACIDDFCGPQSELVYPYTGGLYQRVRIGGTGGDSGAYLLAANIPASCAIGGPIGVELEALSIE